MSKRLKVVDTAPNIHIGKVGKRKQYVPGQVFLCNDEDAKRLLDITPTLVVETKDMTTEEKDAQKAREDEAVRMLAEKNKKEAVASLDKRDADNKALRAEILKLNPKALADRAKNMGVDTTKLSQEEVQQAVYEAEKEE